MKILQISVYLTISFCLIGCGEEVRLSEDFYFPKDTMITLSTEVSNTYKWSAIHFTLKDIPESKTNRDFSDYLEVTLVDKKNNYYRPYSIEDINGLRKYVDARCDNIPRFTKLVKIKIFAKTEIKGTSIIWSTGPGI
jgi:hypothetical protein